MTTANPQYDLCNRKTAGTPIAVIHAKRVHGRAALQSLGYYLQAWQQETSTYPTAGVRLVEGQAIYRKLNEILTEQKII